MSTSELEHFDDFLLEGEFQKIFFLFHIIILIFIYPSINQILIVFH